MLDKAAESLSLKSLTYRSVAKLGGSRIAVSGGVDPVREVATYVTKLDGPAATTMAGDEPLEERIRGRRLYASPVSGQLDPCWVDYGPNSAPSGDSGLPWMPPALAAVLDPVPLGISNDEPSTIVVEISARKLLGIAMWRFMDDMSDQLTDHAVPVTAWIALDGGRIASMRFRVQDAVHALEKDGVDVLATVRATADYVGASDARIWKSFKKYITGDQITTYAYGEVKVPRPRSDQLMSAPRSSDSDPKFCAAARL
ncbi:hypothetical protein ASE12_09490 [Aeromicrobium sp. Root236]|uniref:hypothetical protein n=1 Tax=Aeromicrobium sp. Root236 TaxID=1736498 RepID=UPI0006F5137E|nr:hypothetical protein [Aeromicrobium sp. Root236]KRC64972.1 hypothetical protein ASE12_09490 [Aeromicrobium sp. Root236]